MRLATDFHCIRLHYLSGVTAVSRTKLSSDYLPLLCGVTNKALQASFFFISIPQNSLLVP